MDNVSDVVDKFVNAPVREWDNIFNSLNSITANQGEKDADAYTVRFAEIATYLCMRQCGQDHSGALKDVVQVRRKVRKALGYAYP